MNNYIRNSALNLSAKKGVRAFLKKTHTFQVAPQCFIMALPFLKHSLVYRYLVCATVFTLCFVWQSDFCHADLTLEYKVKKESVDQAFIDFNQDPDFVDDYEVRLLLNSSLLAFQLSIDSVLTQEIGINWETHQFYTIQVYDKQFNSYDLDKIFNEILAFRSKRIGALPTLEQLTKTVSPEGRGLKIQQLKISNRIFGAQKVGPFKAISQKIVGKSSDFALFGESNTIANIHSVNYKEHPIFDSYDFHKSKLDGVQFIQYFHSFAQPLITALLLSDNLPLRIADQRDIQSIVLRRNEKTMFIIQRISNKQISNNQFLFNSLTPQYKIDPSQSPISLKVASAEQKADVKAYTSSKVVDDILIPLTEQDFGMTKNFFQLNQLIDPWTEAIVAIVFLLTVFFMIVRSMLGFDYPSNDLVSLVMIMSVLLFIANCIHLLFQIPYLFDSSTAEYLVIGIAIFVINNYQVKKNQMNISKRLSTDPTLTQCRKCKSINARIAAICFKCGSQLDK